MLRRVLKDSNGVGDRDTRHGESQHQLIAAGEAMRNLSSAREQEGIDSIYVNIDTLIDQIKGKNVESLDLTVGLDQIRGMKPAENLNLAELVFLQARACVDHWGQWQGVDAAIESYMDTLRSRPLNDAIDVAMEKNKIIDPITENPKSLANCHYAIFKASFENNTFSEIFEGLERYLKGAEKPKEPGKIRKVVSAGYDIADNTLQGIGAGIRHVTTYSAYTAAAILCLAGTILTGVGGWYVFTQTDTVEKVKYALQNESPQVSTEEVHDSSMFQLVPIEPNEGSIEPFKPYKPLGFIEYDGQIWHYDRLNDGEGLSHLKQRTDVMNLSDLHWMRDGKLVPVPADKYGRVQPSEDIYFLKPIDEISVTKN